MSIVNYSFFFSSRMKQTMSDGTLKDVMIMKMIEKTKNQELINYICAMKKYVFSSS